MTSHVHQPANSEVATRHEHQQRAAPPGVFDSALLFARTAQLACEGAVSLLLSTSARGVWDGLVQAGLEWEEEYTRVPERGRRDMLERT
jgi:hypothetical protein